MKGVFQNAVRKTFRFTGKERLRVRVKIRVIAERKIRVEVNTKVNF